jgi:hypothetical protein
MFDNLYYVKLNGNLSELRFTAISASVSALELSDRSLWMSQDRPARRHNAGAKGFSQAYATCSFTILSAQAFAPCALASVRACCKINERGPR